MTKEQLVLFINTLDELTIFYNGNANKVATWMSTQNYNLGGSKPIDYFMVDRGQKVLNYVKHAVDENNINTANNEENITVQTLETILMEEGFKRATDALLDLQFRKEWNLDGVECGICVEALLTDKDKILKV